MRPVEALESGTAEADWEVLPERPAKVARRCVLAPVGRSVFADALIEAASAVEPDAILIDADGARHPAHRLILFALSPYFKTMFSSGMLEQSTGEVRLPDIPGDLVRQILGWMYARPTELRCASAREALALLELAQRWQIEELSGQLSCCDAFDPDATSVVDIWEAADRLGVPVLQRRCLNFVLSNISISTLANTALGTVAHVVITPDASPAQTDAANATSPPDYSSLQRLLSLSPTQFRQLIESDILPVETEEHAFHLAATYCLAQWPALALPEGEAEFAAQAAEADVLLLAIRWRLLPGRFLADCCARHHVMRAFGSVGRDGAHGVRPALLPALADAMQFQLLGGPARDLLEDRLSNRVRCYHKIPLASYEALSVGLKVQILGDIEELRLQCKKRALGASRQVSWVVEMKKLAGAVGILADVDEELRGARFIFSANDHDSWWLPFTVMLVA